MLGADGVPAGARWATPVDVGLGAVLVDTLRDRRAFSAVLLTTMTLAVLWKPGTLAYWPVAMAWIRLRTWSGCSPTSGA